MRTINDLLAITTYNPSNLTLKRRQYSEEELMNQAKSMIEAPLLSNQVENAPMIFQNFSYGIVCYFINTKSFTTTKNGEDFLNGFDSVSKNFRILFSYFSKYDKQPTNIEDLYSEAITPFIYYRFITELVEIVSFLPQTSINEQMGLSNLCRYAIFHSPDLCLKSNFNELRHDLLRFFRRIKEDYDVKTFDSIFNTCMYKALTHPYTQETSSVRFAIRKNLHWHKSEIETKCPMLSKESSFASANTYLHDRANMISESWCYPDYETNEEPESFYKPASKRWVYTSQFISYAEFGKTPKGNMLLKIKIEGIPEQVVQLRIKNKKSKIFVRNYKEIVFPGYKGRELIVSFMNAETEIHSITITNMLEPNHLTGKFTYNHSKIKFSIDSALFPVNHPVSLSQHLFGPEASVEFCVDYLIQMLMKEWVYNIGPKPPLEYYTALVDFALKYSIPSSFIFFRILTKLQLCWTSSGQFLQAFTPVFLTCYAMYKQGVVTDREQTSLGSEIAHLARTVPTLLMNTLSKPDIIEQPAVTELLILLSMFHDTKSIDEYFQSILEDSVTNIFKSVLKQIKIIPSGTECSTSVLSLYSCLGTPDKEPEYGKSGLPMISIDVDSIFEATKVLLMRTEKLTAFFTQASLPLFADSHKSIRSDFASLSYRIASAFSTLDPPPCDEQVFSFLAQYRQLWRLYGSHEQQSPDAIFGPVILRWVTQLGPALEDWTTKAIEMDNFEICVKENKASSSVIDLFKIFWDTLQFVDQLDIHSSVAMTCLGSYISLTASSVRSYISLMNKIFEKRSYQTIEKAFVMINDVFMLKTSWKDFQSQFFEKHSIGISQSDFQDPTIGIAATVKSALKSLGFEAALSVRESIFPMLWREKFLSKAFEPAPYNEKTLYAMHESIFSTMERMLKNIDMLTSTFRKKAYYALFSGLENGVIKCLIPFIYSVSLNFSDIVSSLYQSVQQLIEEINDDVKDGCRGEMAHLKWADHLLKKPFGDLYGVKIQDGDELSELILIMVMNQKAESKKEKRYVENEAKKFKTFSLLK